VRITEADGRLVVTTTNEKLAQRIGRALQKAYQGAVAYKWSGTRGTRGSSGCAEEQLQVTSFELQAASQKEKTASGLQLGAWSLKLRCPHAAAHR